MQRNYYIISGGTFVHVAPHFSLSAPAFGTVGRQLSEKLIVELEDADQEDTSVHLVLTRMALGGGSRPDFDRSLLQQAGLDDLITNDDVGTLVDHLVRLPSTRCIVMAAAMCDFEPLAITPSYGEGEQRFGKNSHPRLKSGRDHVLRLRTAQKVVSGIRKERKDIFLVAFKTTAGEDPDRTYARGLKLLKQNSANIVLANDIRRKTNIIITPEEFPYHAETRDKAVAMLAEMIAHRTQLHFVRTDVRDGERADVLALDREGAIPSNFVPVLRHLIAKGAYKPFLGKTSGHFGCKVEGKPFVRISSCRKEDHNLAIEKGMAKIFGFEKGKIVAEGGRPSVGEHTQHRIYQELGDAADSIVHFHCPLRNDSQHLIPQASQFRFECGSQECGDNTATHMRELTSGIFAVQLEGHGPNIAFSRHVPAEMIITFIERHFALDDKTGGVLIEPA